MYIQYVFFSFFKTTSPNMGICGYNNRDNYTPSYLHFALSDTYKTFYQQKADKGDTEHRNYSVRTKTATTTLGTSRAARHHTACGSTDQKGTYTGARHHATVLRPRHLRLQPD